MSAECFPPGSGTVREKQKYESDGVFWKDSGRGAVWRWEHQSAHTHPAGHHEIQESHSQGEAALHLFVFPVSETMLQFIGAGGAANMAGLRETGEGTGTKTTPLPTLTCV